MDKEQIYNLSSFTLLLVFIGFLFSLFTYFKMNVPVEIRIMNACENMCSKTEVYRLDYINGEFESCECK